jgi:hypothetical protein
VCITYDQEYAQPDGSETEIEEALVEDTDIEEIEEFYMDEIEETDGEAV